MQEMFETEHNTCTREGEITRNEYYASALHLAVKDNNVVFIQNMIEHGAKVHAPDKYGRTPLHWALVFGHRRAAYALIINTGRSDLNSKDNFGCTPLHYAAAGARTDLGRILLERGAQINCLDAKRRTPLHYAAGNVRPNMVEMLVSRGAYKECQEYRGFIPCEIALEWGSLSSLACLRITSSKLHPKSKAQFHRVDMKPFSNQDFGKDKNQQGSSGEGISSLNENQKKGGPSIDKLVQAWKIIENNVRIQKEEVNEFTTKATVVLVERLQDWRAAELEAKLKRVGESLARLQPLLR